MDKYDNYGLDSKIIETIPVPIFYKDTNGIYIGCNRAFEDYIGMHRSDIIGRDVYGISPRELADKYREMDEELLKSGDDQFYESSVRTRDGRTKNVVFYKSALKNSIGDRIGVVGVVMDITELKSTSEVKDRIFGIIGHDLRLPLGTSKELLRAMLENFDELKNHEIKEMLTEILESQETVYDLLEKILLWSKSEQGKLRPRKESVSVNGLIREMIYLYRPAFEHKNHRVMQFLSDEEPVIVASRQIIETAIRNLISNAIKYTDDNGRIEISTSIDDRHIFIDIEDNGIGVQAESIDGLLNYDGFCKTYGTNGEAGTGFGLRLSKDLLEKHGGELYMVKKPKGTLFGIKLKR